VASPRDLTGVLRWWSADAPATVVDGRVTEAPDLVAGATAVRFGQGRVGPELAQVDGRPAWLFGGASSPASLLTPDVPAISGAPYAWAVVLTPLAGYAGQVIAPGPNTAVTASSAQLLAEATGSFRWSGFAGTSVSLAMPSGDQLVVLDHDGGTGATRLYASGAGSARATLQRRSLAGQQHIGRHGSNDRPLHAAVRGILLVDHTFADAEVQLLEQWRAEGAGSRTAVSVAVSFPARARLAPAVAARRDVATTVPARARLTAATAGRRDVAAVLPSRARLDAATAARRDLDVALPARGRLAAALAASREAAVVLSGRARLGVPTAATRAVDVQLRARAALQVVVETSRVADVALGLPAAARLHVDVAARRDAAVRLGVAVRLTAATAARRTTAADLPARVRLGAAVGAVRAVAPVLPALARLDAQAAATRALNVVLRAAARLDALVVGRRPVPTSTDGDLVATVGPPEPGLALAAPRPTWHPQEPETGWLLGPPSHQPGGDRWS